MTGWPQPNYDRRLARAAVQHFHQLGDLLALVLRVSARNRVLYAMADVVLKQLTLNFTKRGLSRRDLGNDVDAIAVPSDHPRNPPHLAFDSAEPLQAFVF